MPDHSRTPDRSVKAIYAELGSEIRHYSTIRSTLTTFLITASLAAFSESVKAPPGTPHKNAFFEGVGFVLAVAAPVVCLFFSYKTSKAVMRYIGARNLLLNADAQDNTIHCVDLFKTDEREIYRKMLSDLMNWILIIGDTLLVGCFVFRNGIASLFGY